MPTLHNRIAAPLVVLAAACAPQLALVRTAAADVKVTYQIPVTDEDYATDDAWFWTERLIEAGGIDRIAGSFEGIVEGTASVQIYVRPCGTPNAFYMGDGNVVICYELLDEAAALYLPYATSPGQAIDFAVGVAAGVLGHELGHAAVDLLSLPIVVRGEDAADAFGVYVAVLAGQPQAVVNTAVFWKLLGDGGQASNPKGVHSPAMVRHWNLLCWVFGSGVGDTEWLVWLLGNRALSCDNEWNRLATGWRDLLHGSP